ncbi:MAG: hypothetical protein H7308_04790 [Chthonomonadaceae bacterium]|nr:hypothetical protein [Chthonomonadaceae bacterium]
MKIFSRSLLYGLPFLALVGGTANAQVKLQLLADLDLTPTSTPGTTYIGNNPSALA